MTELEMKSKELEKSLAKAKRLISEITVERDRYKRQSERLAFELEFSEAVLDHFSELYSGS